MIIITSPPQRLSGELTVPGDKSITHRALMIGAIARGITEVRGYLDAGDCRSTIASLTSLGVNIAVRKDRLIIEGRSMRLSEPESVLDAGNSGTTARLLLGILAGQPFSATITGDRSLQQRPMKRVLEPLSRMGASLEGEAERLPVTIRGGSLRAISYQTEKASAQVKSAVLLAGLFAGGTTEVEEPAKSRDHTELMLDYFGAGINVDGLKVTLQGNALLRGRVIRVPGDISAAAYFMVAAAITPGAEVLLKRVGINPTRSGIIEVLCSMGADIKVQGEASWGKEAVANIMVRGGNALTGVRIGGGLIPRLIDEIPVIAVAAAFAEGKTVISDAGELRVKESDRITVLVEQLRKMGAEIKETKEGMIIEGGRGLKGAEVESCGDHRIAMALAIAGLAADGETAVHGAEAVGISFPGFMPALRSLTKK